MRHVVFAVVALSLTLAARGESLAAFDGRCILDPPQRGCRVGDPGAGCVALPSNIPDILGHRALPARRFARLSATPDFHHGLLVSPHQALTQTAPPPSPPPEARPDFSGTWTLDRSISHDPSKASFDPAKARSTQRAGGFGGGTARRPRRLWRFPSDRPDTANDRTPDERSRLQALTDQLRKGSATLVISHHDPSFVINDAQDHTQFFQTDDTHERITTGRDWRPSAAPRIGKDRASSPSTRSAAGRSWSSPIRCSRRRNRWCFGSDLTILRGGASSSQELKLVYTLAPTAPR